MAVGKRQQLLAGNLIGQHGGSGRLSKLDRKAKTLWTETRGGHPVVLHLRQLTTVCSYNCSDS